MHRQQFAQAEGTEFRLLLFDLAAKPGVRAAMVARAGVVAPTVTFGARAEIGDIYGAVPDAFVDRALRSAVRLIELNGRDDYVIGIPIRGADPSAVLCVAVDEPDAPLRMLEGYARVAARVGTRRGPA